MTRTQQFRTLIAVNLSTVPLGVLSWRLAHLGAWGIAAVIELRLLYWAALAAATRGPNTRLTRRNFA